MLLLLLIEFISGYHHYLAAGKAEGRIGGFIPDGWNEERYLKHNMGANIAVAAGRYGSGFVHYSAVGKTNRLVGILLLLSFQLLGYGFLQSTILAFGT